MSFCQLYNDLRKMSTYPDLQERDYFLKVRNAKRSANMHGYNNLGQIEMSCTMQCGVGPPLQPHFVPLGQSARKRGLRRQEPVKRSLKKVRQKA